MVKIITDSSSEFLTEQQEKYGVSVLPMPINFAEGTYMSGVDITDYEFYAKLASSKTLPTTSMINSYTFKKAFEEELSKGNDVVAIVISSDLSVTYSQAVSAAQEVDGKRIFVVDSKNASLGQHALVIEAAKLRDKGLSAEEIFNSLNQLKEKIRLHAMIDTLKYLRAGGRLSGQAAVIGTLLHVKPMMVVEEGKVVNKGKAIGKFNAFRYIINNVKKDDIDFSKTFVLAHGCNEKMAKEFHDIFAKETGIEVTDKALVGATIGVHTGPGAVAVAYFIK